MHNITLLSAILKGGWLIDPEFAMNSGSIIASIINLQTTISEQKTDPYSAYAVSSDSELSPKSAYNNGFQDAPQNSIAIISLKGPLMKNDQTCGPMGMASIGRIIQQADKSANIKAIVLHIDSPGGTVDGTEACANIVRSTTKPVVAYVDGTMASGALWIGSAANEIIASTTTDVIGSVGVVMKFPDMQPYWESKGVVFHNILASKSQDKNKIFEEIRSGNYDNYRTEFLDPIDEKFMSVMRDAFPSCEEKHLTGKVFFAKDVMGIFVNSIGTIHHAIQRADELSVIQAQDSSQNHINKISMKQFPKVNTVLGVDTLESVDDNANLNEEQLELIESTLTSNEQAVIDARTEAESQRDIAVTAQKEAERLLNHAVATFDSIDQKVAEAKTPEEKANAIRTLLSAMPGIPPVVIKSENDSKDSNTEVNWEEINKLPHNIAVDENL